jgi:Dinucleotide-utilizing enzymes involved in molybdopterin and thiamine biosynthesis family 2
MPQAQNPVKDTIFQADEPDTHPLSPEELARYSRHLLLPEVGPEGQKRLKKSRVLIVGAGGLGSPLLMYLAAAGVGEIGIADFDTVDVTNLQRQVAHGTEGVGMPKALSARQRIASLNPHVHVRLETEALTRENALSLIAGYDAVADGTDNFPSRYLINHACALLGIPDIYGSIHQFEGQASVFDSTRGPCYQCLFREPPPAEMAPGCGEAGVLGVVPGIIGCIQAAEVLKVLLGIGSPLYGRLLRFEALAMRFREFAFDKDPHCPVCGSQGGGIPTAPLPDYAALCGFPAAGESFGAERITAPELLSRMAGGEVFRFLDVRNPNEHVMGQVEGACSVPLAEMVRQGNADTQRPVLQRFLAEAGERGEAVVVVCKNGVRSRLAIRALRKGGYAGRLLDLADGLNGWAKADGSLICY